MFSEEQQRPLEKSARAIGDFTITTVWDRANEHIPEADRIGPENAAQKVMELIHARGGECDAKTIAWILFNAKPDDDGHYATVEDILDTLFYLDLVKVRLTRDQKELWSIVPPPKPVREEPEPVEGYSRWMRIRQAEEDRARAQAEAMIDPRTREEQALLAELRSLARRPMKHHRKRGHR